jgi:hypothetical protein
MLMSVRVSRSACMQVTDRTPRTYDRDGERARIRSCCSRCFLLSGGRGKARLGRTTRSRTWPNSPMTRTLMSMSVRVSRSACMQVTDRTPRTYDRDSERARNRSCCSRCFLLSGGRGKARLGRPTRSRTWPNSPMTRTLMLMSARVSRSTGITSQLTEITYDMSISIPNLTTVGIPISF